MKKHFALFITLAVFLTISCFNVLAADVVLADEKGDGLTSYLVPSNDWKLKDGTLSGKTPEKKIVTGIGGKSSDDKSVHGYSIAQPYQDENYAKRQNHKQQMSIGTNVYGIEQCKDKYVVFEANFMPVTKESIGVLTLQPNAGLNISVTISQEDNVISVGRWNHVRFVSEPSTFDAEAGMYPYTYVYVNGKLIKEGRNSAKYNTSYSYLPYRFMADAGSNYKYEQNVYWDDFKVYITDNKPAEYSMPSLYSDGKSTAISEDVLYVYEDTFVSDLKIENGESIVVYDTVTFDYILPLTSKLYDGNLICVNGSDGKITYYTVKKELRNTASILPYSDGFKVTANIKGAVLVAAGYDFSGTLQELKIAPEEGQRTLTISNNCHSVKGFVFESLSSMKPISPVAHFSANPTIACWGASITAGQGGSSSFPGTIAHLSGCNVYNMGIGGETQTTIAARQGGLDIKLTKDIVIPASGSVNIEFAAYNKDDGEYAGVVTPRNTAGAGWNPVTIAGVEGTLSVAVNNDVWPRVLKSATFTRKTAGEAVNVPAGTLMTTSGQELKTDIVIFAVSSNGGWTSANTTANDNQYEGVINLIDRSLAAAKYPDKFLIVGLTTQTNKHWNQVHAALKAKYGEKFLDVRSYLASEKALIDAGITPTELDRQLIAVGQIPPSLISNYPADAVHMNDAGYIRMGTAVYEKLVELGYIAAKEN